MSIAIIRNLAKGGGNKKLKYIFKDGVLNVPISAYPYKASGYGGGYVSGATGIDNNLLVLSQNSGSYGNTSCITEAIDLTDVSAIKITIYDDNNAVNGFYCIVTNTISDGYPVETSYVVPQPRAGIVVRLDTSSLTGNHYLAFDINTANNSYKQVRISEIELIYE